MVSALASSVVFDIACEEGLAAVSTSTSFAEQTGDLMTAPTEKQLCNWLVSHDSNLARFRIPIPLDVVAHETGADPVEIERYLEGGNAPCFHVWEHEHAGKVSRSKPYCLRMSGPTTVGIDWEDSVVGAAESELQRKGFETCRELGSEADMGHLERTCSLKGLFPGTNQRDLWAIKRSGSEIEAWIIEAKGKEAGGFEHYCFAEAMGQLFEVSTDVLTALLGQKRRAGHGLCWRIANTLARAWKEQGLTCTISLAVLVPNWRPDVVWEGGRVCGIPDFYYSRPLAPRRATFCVRDDLRPRLRWFKYERAFRAGRSSRPRTVFDRSFEPGAGLRFRILTTEHSAENGEFKLAGFA